MTKITDLDKAAMIALRAHIDAALKELGEKLGVEFKAGNGGFAGNEAHFKLIIKVADPEIQEAANRRTFDLYCGAFGLKPEHFNKEFRAGSKTYRLIGFELKRRKFPIRVLDLNTNKVVLLTELAIPAIIAA